MRNGYCLPYLVALCCSVATSGAYADTAADVDFAERCAGAGVIWCVGFDTQSEVNQVGQTRYAAASGAESVVDNPQSYPDNIGPDGHLYPAVDFSHAASGAASLRLTANAVGVANHSGGWYLGSAGTGTWPETFSAGETIYLQWRQRYDFAYTNEVNWGGLGGGGVKQLILWRDGSSCSDLEFVVADSGSRGYPQGYTNCGANPLYQCPAGSSSTNCHPYNTDYQPLSGHQQFLYQYGTSLTDFNCMRNFETTIGCGYWRNHYDRWWTYYLEIEIGSPGEANSYIRAWLSRGNGEPMRQFINFGPFPWSYESDKSIQNLVLTLYKTGKESDQHPAATSWYDELIISSEPIATPNGVGAACGEADWTGISTGTQKVPCPPDLVRSY